MAFGLWTILYCATIIAVFSETQRLFSARLNGILPVTATIASFGVASMLAFWLTFLLPFFAMIVCAGFWIYGAWCLYRTYNRFGSERPGDAAILLGMGAAVILLVAFVPLGGQDPLTVAKTVWSHGLPPDNELPFIFARYLMAGDVPSPMVGDWLGSDRPPLQSGFYILTRIPFADPRVAYQISSTAAQMLILPASYALIRAFGGDRRAAILSAIIVGVSPITLIHGAYVWPKLLAAAFLVSACAIHFSPEYKTIKNSPIAGALVGALSVCGMLSHGAAAFTLLGFGLVALVALRWGSLKYTATAILVVLTMYGPWVAYQKIVDPPADRLMKWHLAGVIEYDDERSVLEAISDQYGQFTPEQIAERQVAKVHMSVKNAFSLYKFPQDGHAARSQMFFSMIPALGYLGLFAVLAVAAGFLFSQTRLLSASVFASYLSWILLGYDPALIIVHAGSYFTFIGALLTFCVLLSKWRVELLQAAVIIQTIGALIYFT